MTTTPKRQPKTTKAPKRKPGRPKGGEEVFSPAKLQELGRLYLQGTTLEVLADTFGCSIKTVWTHLQRHIKPAWKESVIADLDTDLAKTAVVEAEAWRRYLEDDSKQDLSDVRWAIEHRAKIFGFYAAKKHEHKQEGARVAGLTPHEYAQRLLGRIMDKAEELKRRDEALLKERGDELRR